MDVDTAWLRRHVRDVVDYPEPGVVFKDITPLLADRLAFSFAIDTLGAAFAAYPIDKVIGIEARGFVVGAPLARRFRAGFVPVRKVGKLPHAVERAEYELEYGTGELEIHRDAIVRGERVLLCDDVLATGGTAAAAVELVRRLGGDVIGLTFLIELAFLAGRKRLEDLDVSSVLTYETP